MNNKWISRMMVFAIALSGLVAAKADRFTPTPGTLYDENGNMMYSTGSLIQTQMRINVEKETDTLHVISANNDPMIITKTYVLKHADPYEIRPYVRGAVTTDRITGGNKQTGGFSKVECIKYNDGTGIMIVSAEDYRFRPQKFGMSIDEIIEALDQPKATSSSGSKLYLYFPRYWDADSLARIMRENGLNVPNDPDELQGGKGKVLPDSQLNALLFFTPQYEMNNVLDMLKLYDSPTFEVQMKYTIYELNTENDDKVGVDFQSWKNGPGADIFSTAGRFTYNWNGNLSDGFVSPTQWNSTKFVKFSPRWNTRYIDFLTAKGKAKVITQGEMNIMNASTGVIESVTSIPRFADGAGFDDTQVGEYMVFEGSRFVRAGTGAVGNVGSFRITAADRKGFEITTSTFTGDISLTRVNYGGETYYEIRLLDGNGAILHSGMTDPSNKIKCYNLTIERSVSTSENVGIDPNTGGIVATNTAAWVEQTDWQTDRGLVIQRNKAIDTVNQSYGFNLTVTPSVCEEATMLDIAMSNTSLIGFGDDGTARTTGSSIETEVMCSNKGQKFVIGGVEKKTVVRSVSKLPWLGSIPLVGWVLGSESESTKKSQIVAVLECLPTVPDSKLDSGVISDQREVDKATVEAGETNGFKNTELGFDQFIFDKSKMNFDPLP